MSRRFALVGAALLIAGAIDFVLWLNSDAIDCWPGCTTYQDVVAYGLYLLPAALISGLVALISAVKRSRESERPR